ncbi:MAG: FHA domain-containing protein [Gemmatimonas sp.]
MLRTGQRDPLSQPMFPHIRVAVRFVGLLALLVAFAPLRAQSAGGQNRDSERATLIHYCDHVDSVASPALAGIQERTDCWKRIQLEGLGNAAVDERYRAAVGAFDALVASATAARQAVVREAQREQLLSTAQRALAARNLLRADSATAAVLAFDSQNDRALSFRQRVFVLERARDVRRTIYMLGGFVLLFGFVLAVSASALSFRQSRLLAADRARAAHRTPMLRIVDGVGRGKTYTLSSPIFRIGSAVSERPEEQNDLLLSDESGFISRYHCALLRRDGNWYLIDSSLNGTTLEDELLERGDAHLLQDGAQFSLSGVARVQFMLVESA